MYHQPVAAQYNDSVFHYFRLASTGIINHTNDANSYALTNAAKFSIQKKALAFNSSCNWLYGAQQQQLTNNDFSAALDVNWYGRNRSFYYWGLGTYESSYSLKVNNRLQAGIGAAYNLVEKKDLFVNLSEGLVYEWADLKITDTTKDVYKTFRNSFRLKWKYTYRLVTIESVSFYQQSLSSKDDYIISSVNSASLKLYKWISIAAAFNYNKVTRNKRENLLFTFGVIAEKYF